MKYYLGLGGNLGNTALYFDRAISALNEYGEVGRESTRKQTAPWGGVKGQDDYLNSVVEFTTDLSPHELLSTLKDIERTLGRQDRKRWYSREIDIDILFAEDLVLNNNGLIIPHPYLHLRSFVLFGMTELAPSLRHPILKLSMLDLSKRLKASGGKNND